MPGTPEAPNTSLLDGYPAIAIPFSRVWAAAVKYDLDRAPDSGGAPGSWANIASNQLLDTTKEFSVYNDVDGISTSWYRYTYKDSANAVLGAVSAAIQAGDSKIRTWLKADLPSTDVTTAAWDRWIEETFTELSTEKIFRELAPISLTGASNTYEYNLTPEVRAVLRVDIYQGTVRVKPSRAWEIWNGQIRLLQPSSAYTYKVYTLGDIFSFGHMNRQQYTFFAWCVRKKYLDYRLGQRSDWKWWTMSDRTSDSDIPRIQSLKADADSEYARRLANLKKNYSGMVLV